LAYLTYKQIKVNSINLAGGVSCNSCLRQIM